MEKPQQPETIAEINKEIEGYISKYEEFIQQLEIEIAEIQNILHDHKTIEVILEEIVKLKLWLGAFKEITSSDEEPPADVNGYYQITIKKTDGEKIFSESIPALKEITMPSQKKHEGYKTRLLGTMAHILNNKLNGIFGYIQLVFEEIGRSAENLKKMTPIIYNSEFRIGL